MSANDMSDGGAPRLSALDHAAGAFDWWRRELRSLLPARPERQGGRGPVVSIEDDVALVMLSEGRRAKSRRAPLPTETDAGASTPARAPRRGPTLIVPEPILLSRRIRLPQAAERRLDAILHFEFGARMPFAAEEAYFAHRVVDRSSAGIEVELICAAKSEVDLLRARLGAVGLAPRLLRLGPREIDLRTWRAGAAPTGRARSTWLCWLLFLGMAGLAVWTPYDQRQQQVQKLERRVDAARATAQEALALDAEIAAERARRAAVADAIAPERPMAAVLEALTRALPDDAWIDTLEIGDGLVRIRGDAAAAAPLIDRLERAPGFANPVFVSSVTMTRGRKERFEIEMRLVPQEAVQ